MNFRRIDADEVKNNIVNLKQITFEVTDACNLQCQYCGYGDLYFGYDKRELKYMTFDQAKLILDYLVNIWENNNTASLNQKTYISFYGGEPLLNMKLIKSVIDYVEQIRVSRNFIFSMTTNAMLLYKYMDYLVEKKINLLISLDGDEFSQSYRVTKSGKNSFEKVFKNVKLLQRMYPEYFLNHVNFNSVLHKRNCVENDFSFIKKEFGKQPTISELNNSGIKPNMIEEFERTYKNKRESLMASENYAKLSEELFLSEPKTHDLLLYLHQYSGNVFKDYNSLFIDENNYVYTPSGTCSPFSKKMFITVNGKIIQCEKIDHTFFLGQITKKDVLLNFDDIANKYNTFLDKLAGQCAVCYRNKSCIQCLYYIKGIESDKMPICQGYMNKDSFDDYSSYCLNHLASHPELYAKLMNDVIVE